MFLTMLGASATSLNEAAPALQGATDLLAFLGRSPIHFRTLEVVPCRVQSGPCLRCLVRVFERCQSCRVVAAGSGSLKLAPA